TTRLAGLEIGSTKLAALAMKAQTNKYGSGSTFAARVAAYTAGVSTTAVASFDRNTVTSVPTVYTIRNNRDADRLDSRTACAASQSNSPSFRATSASSIMPTRKK